MAEVYDYLLSRDLNDGSELQLHGSGTANCGSYPIITIDFHIKFTRDDENDKSKVRWDIENLSVDLHPNQGGRYEYYFFSGIAVNPIDPSDPIDSSGSDNEFYYIIEKDDATPYDYQWRNKVKTYSPGGYTTCTSDELYFYMYVQCRNDCTNTVGGSYCYNISGKTFYPIKGFKVKIEEYATYYDVTFNENGGIANTLPSPNPQQKSSLGPLTLSTTQPSHNSASVVYHNTTTTTKSVGIDFTKWNTQADGSGTNYEAGGQYDVDADCTLYAQWASKSFVPINIPNLNYTVSYISNGGTSVPTATLLRQELGYATSAGGSPTYQPGTSYTLPSVSISTLDLYPIYGNATLSSLPVPTKQGANFAGWYDNAQLEGNPVTAPYTVTGNTTLYAKWANLPIHVFGSDGKWHDIGPYVWRFNGTTWEKIAHVYRFNGTTWEDLSE